METNDFHMAGQCGTKPVILKAKEVTEILTYFREAQN
jgi:hypothetical protein